MFPKVQSKRKPRPQSSIGFRGPESGKSICLVRARRLLPDAFDSILVREFEVPGEADFGTAPDEPLSGIKIKPVRSRAKIIRERMVIVVIHLAPNEEREPPTATCRVVGRILLAAPPVGDRVDAEGHVPLDCQADHASDEQETPEFAEEITDRTGNQEARNDAERAEKFMLETVERIGGQVLDTSVVGFCLPNNPSDMGVPESPVDVVRVPKLITECVMVPMLRCPLHRGALNGARSRDQEEQSERPSCLVCFVGIIAVVTSGNGCRTENKPAERCQEVHPRNRQIPGDPEYSSENCQEMYADDEGQFLDVVVG